MIILGITGPTGSGKTTLLKRIEQKKGCVLDLDAVYHGLLNTDKTLLSALDGRFPGVVRDGVLDRKALGNIVFADKNALQDLNEITGRYILAETRRQLDAAQNAGISMAAIDAINLLEGELPSWCDATIAVTAPDEVRVQRIMARDSVSEEYARLRISAQQSSAYFEARCDYTLRNSFETPEAFADACDALLEIITERMNPHA